jgi:hypothetical protein
MARSPSIHPSPYKCILCRARLQLCVCWCILQVTTYASGNPDFAGSCGRCYEVKCLPSWHYVIKEAALLFRYPFR